MSLSDRDYYRNDQRKRSAGNGSGLSAVAMIILLNVVCFIVNQATGNVLFDHMQLDGTTTASPLQWYRCLTYAFAHDPNGFMHIFFNMLALFFFGIPVERLYGKKEFLWFYLISAVFGGLVWNVQNAGALEAALGASGAITAVIILFTFNFPRQIILIWGILPLPAWLCGILFVFYDMFGAVNSADQIAHDIHLSGAVFAALYFWSKIRFTRFLTSSRKGGNKGSDRRSSSERKESLSFTVKNDQSFDKLEAEVDEILRKISRSGEESLTKKERETLIFASQEYQKRKNRQD